MELVYTGCTVKRKKNICTYISYILRIYMKLEIKKNIFEALYDDLISEKK